MKIDPSSKYNSVRDLDLSGRRVLVRVDFNVPLEDGEVASPIRIRKALPTIEYLKESDAKIILMSHLGRPGGEEVEELRMDPVADSLSELLGEPVKKASDCVGEEVVEASRTLREGEVMLLENTRFHEGEKKNDEEFSGRLAEVGDVFVNDAFGTVHRKHASTYGVAKKLPSAAGLLIMKEIKGLNPALEDPDHPFVAILGGKKASSKIGALWDLMDRVDVFLVGGALAFTFLDAKGYIVGDSLVENSMIDEVREFIEEVKEKNIELVLPVDAKISQEFSETGEVKITRAEKIPPGWMGLDIGPAAIEEFSEEIEEAEMIVWAGPLGGFELDTFREGTKKIAEKVADSSAYRVIGGGETGSAINKLGLTEKMDHVSTGGGACLGYLRGKSLPALEVLEHGSG